MAGTAWLITQTSQSESIHRSDRKGNGSSRESELRRRSDRPPPFDGPFSSGPGRQAEAWGLASTAGSINQVRATANLAAKRLR